MSIITAEFTVEPFDSANPGPHVQAAIAAARAHEVGAVEVEVGPFGTSARGPVDAILALLHAVNQAALAEGATRISVQISS